MCTYVNNIFIYLLYIYNICIQNILLCPLTGKKAITQHRDKIHLVACSNALQELQPEYVLTLEPITRTTERMPSCHMNSVQCRDSATQSVHVSRTLAEMMVVPCPKLQHRTDHDKVVSKTQVRNNRDDLLCHFTWSQGPWV